MTSGRIWVTTHTVAFIAGFVAAKAWDSDELNSYRDRHESGLTKVKRWAGNISIGLVACGVMTLVFRASSLPSASKSSP
jgi:hypothetical protein